MTPRGYIKSKYVIKIYENSLSPNSAEWESNTSYEPLTIVTYNNKSYLSKTNVPTSASNPASEPTYWVLTGFVNEIDSIKQALANEILYFDIPVNAITGYIVNVSGGIYANITADHVVTSCVFDKPTAIYGNVTWQTGAGTLQLAGKCGDASNHYVHITLAKKGN